jgi:inner membrane protein
MNRKTHVVAGISTALIAAHPTDLKNIAVCVAVSFVGSSISDIDVVTSKSHKDIKWLTLTAIAIAAVIVILNRCLNNEIYNYISSNSSAMQLLIGILFFMFLALFGSKQPHRTFTHSLLGCILFTSSVAIIFPKAYLYFAFAFLSHIALDLLNEKNVQLLYPSKKLSFCFSLCKAGKGFDNFLSLVFSIVMASALVYLIVHDALKLV